MAFDAFIKIGDIEGESTDDKHAGWIEITDYSMDITQTISTTASSSGGASAERADFTDFSITKQLDKATPKLALACADGTHFGKIVVELCRAGTDKLKFVEFILTNCILSSISMAAGKEFPEETISINYGKIEWGYVQQKRQGGYASGNVVAGWDQEKNCKV